MFVLLAVLSLLIKGENYIRYLDILVYYWPMMWQEHLFYFKYIKKIEVVNGFINKNY